MGGCSFEYNIPFLTRLFKKKVKVGGLHGSIKVTVQRLTGLKKTDGVD